MATSPQIILRLAGLHTAIANLAKATPEGTIQELDGKFNDALSGLFSMWTGTDIEGECDAQIPEANVAAAVTAFRALYEKAKGDATAMPEVLKITSKAVVKNGDTWMVLGQEIKVPENIQSRVAVIQALANIDPSSFRPNQKGGVRAPALPTRLWLRDQEKVWKDQATDPAKILPAADSAARAARAGPAPSAIRTSAAGKTVPAFGGPTTSPTRGKPT